jgi:DNA polymerase-4
MCSMRDDASILHADLDSFYASVEQRDDPTLRGKPVIVGGGVVLAASYEAKAYGVRTPMGYRQWKQLCPQAIVVPPRFDAYTEASRAVFAIFEDTSPLVEGISIDEAFLDVRGLRRIAGEPLAIGAHLRTRVRVEVGLPITVGVARTKFLAKVASRTAKPDGLLLVPPGGELAFLHPLPVDALWGVGEKTATKLGAKGIHTVADVAALPEEVVVSIVGRAVGHQLHSLSNNRDPRPVVVGRRRGSIGSQSAIGWGAHTPEQIDATVLAIVDRVTRRMRKAGRIGRTVVLRLRFDDMGRITRSHTMPMSTSQSEPVLDVARGLLASVQPLVAARGITLVGLSVANLDNDPPSQLTLPLDAHLRGTLDGAIDDVRERFGSLAVTRAVHLGRDVTQSVPMLPD